MPTAPLPRCILIPIRLLPVALFSIFPFPGGSQPASDGFKAFVCDPARSSVTYRAIHPFAKVNGVHRAPACTVWVNPDTTAFRIRVSMPVRGFKSGIGLRDSHAMKAIDADAHPVVSFSSGSARPQAGKTGPYAVSGELEFHGLTGTIAATIVPELKDGVAVIRGGFPISLAEYKAKPPTLMGTRVRDRLDLDFELVFRLKPVE